LKFQKHGQKFQWARVIPAWQTWHIMLKIPHAVFVRTERAHLAATLLSGQPSDRSQTRVATSLKRNIWANILILNKNDARCSLQKYQSTLNISTALKQPFLTEAFLRRM
jgi:hypothetical protein